MKWGVLLVLGLAGCQVQTPTPSISLVPDAEGVLVQPYQMRIDFGRSPKGVVPVLDRELGVHKAMPLTKCPAGIARQSKWGSLVLSFTQERFVGWRQGTQTQGLVCAP